MTITALLVAKVASLADRDELGSTVLRLAALNGHTRTAP